MAEQEEDLVAVIVGWIGTFLATYFFVSPVIPYIKVLKGEMKISDSPGILLICNMINTIIWTTYGLVGNTEIPTIASPQSACWFAIVASFCNSHPENCQHSSP